MSGKHRSQCPISLSLELIGDRWTLLIIRDIVFGGKSHFREFLQSGEGISSRTLAERLQTGLCGRGIGCWRSRGNGSHETAADGIAVD